MAAGDRESTFILRAADLSSQPVKDVVAQVEKLIAAQDRLNQSAAAGTVSNADFKKSLADLQAAFKALVDQKATLTEFTRAQEAYQARLVAVAAAEARLAAFRQSLPAEDERTTKQVNGLARVEKSLLSAQSRAETAQRYFDLMTETLARMGVSSDGVAAAEEKLSAAIAAAGPAAQRAAIENLSLIENRRKAAEAAAAQEAAERKLAAAEREFVEANRAANAQRQAQDAALLAQEKFEQQTRANFRRADVEAAFAAADAEAQLAKQRDAAQKAQQDQLERLRASQAKVAQAQDSIPAIQPPGAGPTASPDFFRASQAISSILSPSQQLRETLHGLRTEVASVTAVLDDQAHTDREYEQSLRRLAELFIGLRHVAALADTYKDNETQATRLREVYERENATLQASIELYNRAGVADDAMQQRILRQSNVVKAAAQAFNDQNIKLTESRRAMEQAGIGADTLTDDLRSLTAIAGRAASAAEQIQSKLGKSSDFTFLGLRPYEFRNLTYQINDVFTQLASGTSITQTFSQQFGQIFQLYEVKLVNLYNYLKQIPGAIGGIGVAATGAVVGVLALVRALELAAARREFTAALALDPDRLGASVEGLEKATLAASKLGVAYADAGKAALTLSKAGFSDDQIRTLLTISAKLAVINGKPIDETVKAVADAFRGGYEDVHKFALEYVRLTDGQDQYIREAFRANDADRARTELLAAIAPRIEDAYTKAQSGLSRAFTDLKNSFNSLLDTLSGAETFFVRWFALIVHGADNAAKAIARIGQGAPPSLVAADMAGGIIPQTAAAGPAASGGDQTARNVRDRNPANLEFRNQPGATRDDNGRFAKFDTFESGVAAALNQALLDQSRGLRSIQQIVEKNTPPVSKGGDNPDAVVQKYIAEVSKALGVKPDQPVNLSDRDTAIKYIAAIARQEGGVPPREAIEAGVDRRLSQGSAVVPNRQAIADRAFEEDQQKRQAQQLAQNATEDQHYKSFVELAKASDEEIAKSAAERAKKEGVAEISQTEVVQAQAAARLALWRSYNEQRAARDAEVTSELTALRDKELNADKTNLAARLKANNDYYDNIDKKLAEKNAQGRFPSQDGTTYDQARETANAAREAAANRITIETAEAILKSVEDSRKAALALIHDSNGSIADLDRVNKEYAPKLIDAARRSNEALQNVPDSDQVRALRTRNQTVLTGGENPQNLSDTEASVRDIQQRVQKPLDDLFTIRDNAIKRIVEDERRGALTLAQGLQQTAEVTSTLGPRLKAAVDKTNADLLAIRNAASTSELDRSRIDAIIAENKAKAAHDQELIQSVIEAGLQDDQKRLDATIKERDTAIAEVTKKLIDGIIKSPLEAARQIAEIYERTNPQVRAASDRLANDLRAGIASPAVSPGTRADLTSRLTTVGKESDTGQSELEATRKLIEAGISNIQNAVSSTRDVQGTQKQLLDKNLTTPERAEETVKKAFDDANRSIAGQQQELEKLIERYKALGASDTEVDKLRDKIKLLNSDLKYVDPLTQQITKTLEDSIGNRGVQAFETIAQSIGNLLVHGGKLKDVFAAAGQAFASFTAGVLQDVAKMIIKFYLLRAIKSLLGIGGAVGDAAGGAADAAGGAADAAGGAFDGAGTTLSSVAHSGGLVGDSGVRRVVDLSQFREARRMHTGGMVGLAPDEVPAILQRGERVMSVAQVRQQQQATSGSTPTAVRNVLAVGDDEISKAMAGSHGEQVVLNHLRRNAPTVRKLVGG